MKKRTNTILTAFLMGVSICTHAQNYDDYNLNSYKTPDIKRSLLDFTFNSNGEFATNVYNDKNTFELQGLVKSYFNRYVSTRHFIGEQSIEVAVSGITSDQYSNSDNKRKNFSLGASYDNLSRFYYTDKCFWATGGSATFSYDKVKEGGLPSNEQLNFGISPLISVGRGRIEPVQDARQAVYILSDLSKRGYITKKLSEQEVNGFAQIISAVKNKRFLDYRLHLIDEISHVDSFLLSNNYLKKSGAGYFTTLYDYWLYGALFQRGAGCEVSANLTPYYKYDKRQYQYQEMRMNQTGVSANVSLNYEKPINLYWQQSAVASVIGFYNSTKRNGVNQSSNERCGIIQGKYSIGYYPNSRTNLNIGVSEEFSYNDFDGRDFYYSTTSLNLSTYYYISPQFRLSGNVNLINRNTDNDSESSSNRWMGNYSLTLTYSLF